MRVLVPLAGPDFVRADGTLKALISIDGPQGPEPFLRHVLQSRPWAGTVHPEDYSFVLIDRPETRAFVNAQLADWYPGASVTFLSGSTRGSALSTLAAVASGRGFSAPLIVDLADILYSGTLAPVEAFDADPDLGGIALTFRADSPAYSYLRTDAGGNFVEAAEKRVISNEASAGTYVFRDTPIFLRAIAHAMENEESQAFEGSFFVCPLFNGIPVQGKTVILESVRNVHDIKMSHACV